MSSLPSALPAPLVSPAVVGTVVTALAAPPAPRILATTTSGSTVLTPLTDQEWQVVESRRPGHRRRRLWTVQPRRPVPADFCGQCFNCFSLAHRAVVWRLRTRCFKCHTLGHRSFECGKLLSSGKGGFKFKNQSSGVGPRSALLVKVWRPKVLAPAMPVIMATCASRPRPSSFTWEATMAGGAEMAIRTDLRQDGV
jgi:hypothetical protein